jgi:hypothetical protein
VRLGEDLQVLRRRESGCSSWNRTGELVDPQSGTVCPRRRVRRPATDSRRFPGTRAQLEALCLIGLGGGRPAAQPFGRHDVVDDSGAGNPRNTTSVAGLKGASQGVRGSGPVCVVPSGTNTVVLQLNDPPEVAGMSDVETPPGSGSAGPVFRPTSGRSEVEPLAAGSVAREEFAPSPPRLLADARAWRGEWNRCIAGSPALHSRVGGLAGARPGFRSPLPFR